MSSMPSRKRDGSPASVARAATRGTTDAPGTPWWTIPVLVGLAFVSAGGFLSVVVMVKHARKAPGHTIVTPIAEPERTAHVNRDATTPVPVLAAEADAAREVPARNPSVIVPTAPAPAVAASVAPESSTPAPPATVVDAQASPDTPRPQESATAPANLPATTAKPEKAPLAPSQVVDRGRALFDRRWSPNDPLSHGDGLGPVHNATSCLDCHRQGGPGGGGPANTNAVLVTALGHAIPTSLTLQDEGFPYRLRPFPANRIADADRAILVNIDPGFADSPSIVLHRFGVETGYIRWRNTFSAALHQIPIESSARGRGPAQPFLVGVFGNIVLHMTERNPTPLFGAGLIDCVSRQTLTAIASSQSPEIRGKVATAQLGDVGRFGWKAQIATLNEFVLSACANELGLEVAGHHQAASPLSRTSGRGLDLFEQDSDALVEYVRSLPAPTAVPAGDSKDAEQGQHIFSAIGCAGCHMPSVGTIEGIYSDLLVHDMGPSLSDPGTYYGGAGSRGAATTSEWRTPPLWGASASRPYLHDGRAATLDEAVLLHGGQGETSAQQFQALSPRQRAQVRAFLNTLAPPPPDRVIENGARFQTGAVTEEVAQRAENWLKLGQSLERKGKTRRAVEFYREVLKSAPNSPAAIQAADRLKSLTGSSTSRPETQP